MDNENIIEGGAPEIQTPPKGQKFKAKVKEWFRKKAVALKRSPQNIALLVLVITSIFFLLSLFVVSQSIQECKSDSNTQAVGICNFISTLLSILVLVSFLNAFPKRKKANKFFIALVFVMIAAILACDIGYYIQVTNCLKNITDKTGTMYATVSAGQPYIMAHMILLAVSAAVFALLPLYRKLINKINTKVVLESSAENMSGEIDIEE